MRAIKRTAFRRNVFWQVIGSGGQAIASGLILLIMGRELGAHDFGIFSIVMGLVYVANALVEPRMQDVAAKQFWDIEETSAEHHAPYFIDLLALEVVAKLIPCVALLLLASVLASMNDMSGGANLILLAGAGYYLSKLGNGLALGTLRVLGRSDISAACIVAEQVIRLLIMIAIMWLSKLSVLNCIVALCIAGIVANAAQWYLVRRQFLRVHLDVRGWRWSDAVVRLRQNRKLLLSNIGLSISELMNKDFDVTIIAQMMAPASVGIYKMAKSITMLAWRVIDPVYLSLMPEMSRLVSRKEFDSVDHLLRRSSILLFVFATGLGIVVYFALLLFGEKLLGPAFGDVAKYLPLMLVGVAVGAPLIWSHPLLVALNCAELAVYGILASAAFGVAVFVLLVPPFGIYGAIAGWLTYFIFTFGFMASAAYLRLIKARRVAS